MRILFCTDAYPPQVNGVSVVTAVSVAGLMARGWEVAVVAPEYPDGLVNPFTGPLETADVRITTLASRPLPPYPESRLAVPDYRAVAGAIDDLRPGIVHCATEFVIGRLGQIAARRRDLLLTSSYHTDVAKYVVEYGVPWLRGGVSSYIRRFHGRSRRIYTPSAPARDYLLSLGLDQVEVWGRGVDTDTYHPARRTQAWRERLGMPQGFIFLHAGRLAAEKNVPRVLEAYALAHEALPAGAIHLVIAGAGPAEADLRAAAPRDVRFLGYLDRRTELPALYASSDAFLFASLTETLGLVVLEAMASGTPVIAAPAGGVADHLRDGENGLAYPPDDAEAMAAAMIRLATDHELHATLARGARRTAERLSWKAELDRLDESYRELLAGRSLTLRSAPAPPRR